MGVRDIIQLHARFFVETVELNKFGASYLTLLPSLMFLFTNFLITYKFCHRYTRLGHTSMRAWFLRELTFHWAFFYLSKFWFIFMKTYKFTTEYICENYVVNKRSLDWKGCQLAAFFILSLISMLPIVLYVIRSCSRPQIPNFLMWIGEDPWQHTEIGTAGHYLARPPRFALPADADLPYRTKRSASIQERARKGTFVRLSKSMEFAQREKPKAL